MTKQHSAEKGEPFVKLVNKWIGIEDATIIMAGATLKKMENPVLRTIVDTIQRDSEKHREVLQLLLQQVEGTFVLTPDDMAALHEFIEKHEGIEKGAIELAELTLKSTTNEVAKFLLSYILEDEKKHDLLIDGLNKLKSRSM